MHKKPITLILLCLMAVGLVKAQDNSQKGQCSSSSFKPHVELGAVFGGTTNTYHVNTHYAYDEIYRNGHGLNGGVSFLWQANPWLGLRTDPVLTNKNYSQCRAMQVAEPNRIKYKNTYLQLPIMADFSFGGSRLRGHLDLGLYCGYWMKSNVTGTEIAFDCIDSYNYAFDEPYEFDKLNDNRFDMGYAAATGISYLFGNHFRLQAEVSLFYNLVSTHVVNPIAPDPTYNTTMTANIGAYWVF